MIASRRTTIYFDPDVFRALRLKSVAIGRPISEIVNEAVRHSLAEEAEDLGAVTGRARKASLDFEAVVKDLKKRGKL